MAYEENLDTLSAEAGSDLSTYQYRFVTRNNANQLALTGAGVAADGVLQNKPAAQGRAANIGIAGVSKVVTGAAVAKGDQLMSDATGRGITQTGSNIILGKALDSSGSAGVIVPVQLNLT
jgi:hypothetical protein